MSVYLKNISLNAEIHVVKKVMKINPLRELSVASFKC